jgi:hypothetical protein
MCVLAVSFPLPHTYDYLLSSTHLPLLTTYYDVLTFSGRRRVSAASVSDKADSLLVS